MVRTVALLFVLLHALVGAQGAVVCYERNGHIAYESIAARHAPVGMVLTSSAPRVSGSEAGLTPTHGPCVDPASSGIQRKTAVDGQFLERLPFDSASLPGMIQAPLAPCELAHSDARMVLPGLAPGLVVGTRTTVLRI